MTPCGTVRLIECGEEPQRIRLCFTWASFTSTLYWNTNITQISRITVNNIYSWFFSFSISIQFLKVWILTDQILGLFFGLWLNILARSSRRSLRMTRSKGLWSCLSWLSCDKEASSWKCRINIDLLWNGLLPRPCCHATQNNKQLHIASTSKTSNLFRNQSYFWKNTADSAKRDGKRCRSSFDSIFGKRKKKRGRE